jgi:hypothetical protein
VEAGGLRVAKAGTMEAEDRECDGLGELWSGWCRT